MLRRRADRQGRLIGLLALLLSLATAPGHPARAAEGQAGGEEGAPAAGIPSISGVVEDYARTCAGCHLPDGSGMPGLVPAMKGFVGYFTHLPEGREFIVRVPGVSLALLDDARLTAVINWTLFQFSPAQLPPGFQPYTVEEVSRLRKQPLNSIEGLRAALIARLREMGRIPADQDGLGPRVLR